MSLSTAVMKFPIHVERFEELTGLTNELHLAIGMFDGVHRGHQSVIESAVLSAQRSKGISGVLTFNPHPSRLFRPEKATCLMMTLESKLRILSSLGVNIVICKQFDHAFASISAEDFLPYLKKVLPTLKSVYVGENFRFGKMRAGSVTTLIDSGNRSGIRVFSAERIQHDGEPISSTRIRRELEAGRIHMVNDLLGYNYRSDGTIVGGKKLGRKIGFPTLNVSWSPECRPKYGVYHVRFSPSTQESWEFGVANYGIRPTVESAGQAPLLEVHGLSEIMMDPGDGIIVEWLHFIRSEQTFESVELLKEQIAKDCERARKLSDSYG